MRTILSTLFVFTLLIGCKENTEKDSELIIHDTVEIQKIEAKSSQKYPKSLTTVFNAHGGMDTWNQMNNLCFEMEGRGGIETHTTDLKDRYAKIEHKDWSIGYDGSDVWLLQNKEDAYGGNARFYHNLMFYFYAMPFVLGDDGIVYSEMEPRELDGTTYNAIKISYHDGVGDSPKDEYILFYDQDTNKMAWLGYTVTFGKEEKSERWSFIKYGEWEEINGLLLPKTLSWYTVEDNVPTAKRNDMNFNKVTVSSLKLDASVFAKPENATISPLE